MYYGGRVVFLKSLVFNGMLLIGFTFKSFWARLGHKIFLVSKRGKFERFWFKFAPFLYVLKNCVSLQVQQAEG